MQWPVASMQWSVASMQWLVAGMQWSVAGMQWSVASMQWSVAGMQWSVASMQWAVAGMQWPLPTSHCPLPTAHSLPPNPIIAQALKVLGYVNMFNRGISRVKRLMLDNGGEEPRFDITKITAFEVLSYSAMKIPDNQRKVLRSEAELSQLVTKIFTKLVPDYFPSKEEENLSVLIRSLIEPQKATDLSALLGLTDRTLRNRYLAKMLRAGVIELTIPDKPTSRNQRYRLKK